MAGDWTTRAVSPAEAVAHVRSGMTVFLHGAAATPHPLIRALAARTDLENVRVVHLQPLKWRYDCPQQIFNAWLACRSYSPSPSHWRLSGVLCKFPGVFRQDRRQQRKK